MERSALEDAVVKLWRALPYKAFTQCATCGEGAYCAGVNLDSRVCVGCFDSEHDCKPPNYRRRRVDHAAA